MVRLNRLSISSHLINHAEAPGHKSKAPHFFAFAIPSVRLLGDGKVYSPPSTKTLRSAAICWTHWPIAVRPGKTDPPDQPTPSSINPSAELNWREKENYFDGKRWSQNRACHLSGKQATFLLGDSFDVQMSYGLSLKWQAQRVRHKPSACSAIPRTCDASRSCGM